MTTLNLLAAAASLSSSAHFPGFVGSYHAAPGVVNDGHGTTAFDVGKWGIVAPENTPTDGGMPFKEDIDFLCHNASINGLWGMIIGHSEGGVLNNPNDTDVFNPLPVNSQKPNGSAGILQGAARWSALARTYCPQIQGIVVDDFWSNYVEDAPPPSPPAKDCPSCPAARPHMYGSFFAGFFCCKWPATGHCTPPAGQKGEAPCCVAPGDHSGCQGVERCGNNPKNATPCGAAPPINLAEMREIKAALSGKQLLPSGKVNHSSSATTPHLKLMAVTYVSQIETSLRPPQRLLSEGIVDAISFWMGGQDQRMLHRNLTSFVRTIRRYVGPAVPIITGGYIRYSSVGWEEPSPFYDMLEQSIELYESMQAQGFFLFAGTQLSLMNASLWQHWALPEHLEKLYWPWVGGAEVTVVDEKDASPIVGALALVGYGAPACTQTMPTAAAQAPPVSPCTDVTRKRAAQNGIVTFGGWAGRERPTAHHLHVSAAGYAPADATVQLIGGQTVRMTISLSRTGAEERPASG
jgi:hypothetical protein